MFPATTRDRSITRKPCSIPWKSRLKDFCCIFTSSMPLCPTPQKACAPYSNFWCSTTLSWLCRWCYLRGTTQQGGRVSHGSLPHDLLQPLTCPDSTSVLEESAVQRRIVTCQELCHGVVC